MNTLTRFNRLDDLLPELMRHFVRPQALANVATDTAGAIRVDVTETDKDCAVRAEVPGARKMRRELAARRHVRRHVRRA